MSYQYKRADTRVVVCDVCGAFSWIGNRDWHEMPQHVNGQALHLCTTCRPTAIWCAAHQQYHRPDILHRQPCIDCGGLFTSRVRDGILRCPACQRLSGILPAPPRPHPQEAPRSLMHRILHLWQ